MKILILLLGLLSLSACGSEIVKSGNKDIDLSYNLISPELNNMSDINEMDLGMYVSSKAIEATVEISVNINFSYTQTFNSMFGSQSQTRTSSISSEGTGFFINEDGYLLTNCHVIESGYESYKNYREQSKTIQINYAESKELIDVSIVAKNKELDLAILKADYDINNLKYLEFFNITNPLDEAYKNENSPKLYYGETVYACGNAYGYGISITSGVVSAPYRYFVNDDSTTTLAIQTDAAINSGNSGGPLLNKYGYVIGVNSFKLASTGVEGLGFAIPSNVCMDYIKSVDPSIKYYYTTDRLIEGTILSNISL